MLKQWFGVVWRAYNTSVVVYNAKKGNDIYEGVNRTTFEVKRDKKGRLVMKAGKDKKVGPVARRWNGAKIQVACEMKREGKVEWVISVPQAIRDSGITNFEKVVCSGQARNQERKMGDHE